jgi:hypothetical protein
LEYDDFRIYIGPPSQGAFQVSVDSSKGEGKSSFKNPFKVGIPADSETIGRLLFEKLFNGEVRRLYDESLGAALASGRGLRIRLRIDAEGKCAGVAALPWELLYDPLKKFFLNKRLETPIIRHLITKHPPGPEHLEPPLRILIAAATPSGVTTLDLASEVRLLENLQRSLKSKIDVHVLRHAQLHLLAKTLRERGPFDVLHFSGHGDFDPGSHKGSLLLETEDGAIDSVTGQRLADQLGHLLKNLPLVVLNACYTGNFSAVQPSGGVATALVQCGVPAVVAMGMEISNAAATSFSKEFYRYLAMGEPIEMAMTAARQEILEANEVPKDWSTPILYHRPGPSTRTPPPPPPPPPLWSFVVVFFLGVLLFFGLLQRPRPGQATVQISFPSDGAKVSSIQQIRGSASGRAQYHYLFVSDPNEGCWLQEPAPFPVNQEGIWLMNVPLGGNPGDQFTIIAIASDHPLEDMWRPGIRTACNLIPGSPAVRAERSVEIGPEGSSE